MNYPYEERYVCGGKRVKGMLERVLGEKRAGKQEDRKKGAGGKRT
jgi:hypothetical protein